MKTLKGWKKEGGDFGAYVFPGERIDVEIYDYFLGCLPPAVTTSYGFLMGETYDFDKNGGSRYLAFFQIDNEYFYGGHWIKKDFISVTVDSLYDHFHPSLFNLNERGNAVFYSLYMMRSVSRYYICLSEKWLKYHTSQDANYFAVFVNWSENAILTFCEGDESIVCCSTQDRFLIEYQVMEDFYRRC